MKNTYQAPAAELILLRSEDILTLSAGFDGEEHDLFSEGL